MSKAERDFLFEGYAKMAGLNKLDDCHKQQTCEAIIYSGYAIRCCKGKPGHGVDGKFCKRHKSQEAAS